jgi:hypothetical protein
MFKTRVCTTALIEMMEDGVISAEDVATMCLNHMSEADVRDMMESNDLLDEEDDE